MLAIFSRLDVIFKVLLILQLFQVALVTFSHTCVFYLSPNTIFTECQPILIVSISSPLHFPPTVVHHQGFLNYPFRWKSADPEGDDSIYRCDHLRAPSWHNFTPQNCSKSVSFQQFKTWLIKLCARIPNLVHTCHAVAHVF